MHLLKDDPYRLIREPYSIQRWLDLENARDRDNAGETRSDSEDWLVRLIERRLRGEL